VFCVFLTTVQSVGERERDAGYDMGLDEVYDVRETLLTGFLVCLSQRIDALVPSSSGQREDQSSCARSRSYRIGWEHMPQQENIREDMPFTQHVAMRYLPCVAHRQVLSVSIP
jgi:hypothetical protein